MLHTQLSNTTNVFDPERDDLFSFVASVMYATTYAECCEWKDNKPYPEGKKRRDRAKQFLVPIVAECGGISVDIVNDYDFSGYVTKYNILCSDGRTIMPGAFKNCDGKVIPLVDYDYSCFNTLDNVLGHILLENREDGVYGYGIFHNSQRAKTYQQLVEDELINGLGIYANQLKANDKCVIYGVIQSVALCPCPANPQAKIDIVNRRSKKYEERPQGEWLAREDMDYLDKNKVVHNHFECNKCGFIHDFIDGHTSQYNFCPSCGAEMRGERR
jgi:hypothetical protein